MKTRRPLVFAISLCLVSFGGFAAPDARAASDLEVFRREHVLKNDGGLIGASMFIYLIDHPEVKSFTFGVDANGDITGILRTTVRGDKFHLGPGLRVLQGTVHVPDGTFVLQHDDAFGGQPVTFSFEGKVLQIGSRKLKEGEAIPFTRGP